ncbi:hypothetical protein WR25_18139 [Diploscapter pachys]|uniref:Uncharacterized protein n=1 Tax=Diploscapter pachys TaxID=2018661 RepID=A0A2A2M5T5_9BILA|nr:hypothetical protein WR25_18139 [Diploscapter pachys]
MITAADHTAGRVPNRARPRILRGTRSAANRINSIDSRRAAFSTSDPFQMPCTPRLTRTPTSITPMPMPIHA